MVPPAASYAATPDKIGTTFRGAHRGFCQHATDLIGLLVPRRADRLPDLNLAPMIWIDREGHHLLQRHLVLGIESEKGRGHGCDVFVALTLLAQRQEGAELASRMMPGMGAAFAKRFCFTKIERA